jgi:glutathione S-transferase
MHSGFTALRSALPMNLKAQFMRFRVWSRAQADIDRITALWRDCLASYGGPYLFGRLSMADAMYAPVVTRFRTYGVGLDPACSAYARAIMDWPDMAQWVADAQSERIEIDELEVEF